MRSSFAGPHSSHSKNKGAVVDPGKFYGIGQGAGEYRRISNASGPQASGGTYTATQDIGKTIPIGTSGEFRRIGVASGPQSSGGTYQATLDPGKFAPSNAVGSPSDYYSDQAGVSLYDRSHSPFYRPQSPSVRPQSPFVNHFNRPQSPSVFQGRPQSPFFNTYNKPQSPSVSPSPNNTSYIPRVPNFSPRTRREELPPSNFSPRATRREEPLSPTYTPAVVHTDSSYSKVAEFTASYLDDDILLSERTRGAEDAEPETSDDSDSFAKQSRKQWTDDPEPIISVQKIDAEAIFTNGSATKQGKPVYTTPKITEPPVFKQVVIEEPEVDTPKIDEPVVFKQVVEEQEFTTHKITEPVVFFEQPTATPAFTPQAQEVDEPRQVEDEPVVVPQAIVSTPKASTYSHDPACSICEAYAAINVDLAALRQRVIQLETEIAYMRQK